MLRAHLRRSYILNGWFWNMDVTLKGRWVGSERIPIITEKKKDAVLNS